MYEFSNSPVNISITGTKGKTTILSILASFLVKYSNVMTSSSTEGMTYNNNFIRFTEPDSYLRCTDNYNNPFIYDYMISEATSYLLAEGIYNDFNSNFAIYTGIEETEHLDYHKSFKKYFSSKKKLFDLLNESSVALINSEDDASMEIVRDCSSKKIITYGQNKAFYEFEIKSITKKRMKIKIQKNKKFLLNITTKLLGVFNASNITACIAILDELNFDINLIRKHFSHFVGVAGRFQRIYITDKNIVVIDYAHTPNSLRNVIALIREIYPQKQLITIFGCGGEKSQQKRPLMGAVASDNSDYCIITSDNSRREDFTDIAQQITKGIRLHNYKLISDRKEAFKNAILNSENSIILLAGRGSEKFFESSSTNIEGVCKTCNKKSNFYLKTPLLHKTEISDYDLVTSVLSKNSIKFIDPQKIRNKMISKIFP